MTDFLIPINENNTSQTPYILIDVSGSTADKMLHKHGSIRDYEFEITKKLVEKYRKAVIICWSDRAHSFGEITYEKYTDDHFFATMIQKSDQISSGTNLMTGLSLIDMTTLKDNTEIIVLTDGEISDSSSEIRKMFNNLSSHKVHVQIIAVERGKKDYLESNCNVANTLYNMIRNEGMTRLVNKFLIYNDCDKEFINFYNPVVPNGYIPFRELMFKKTDMTKFIKHINTLVTTINVDEQNYEKKIYLRIAYDLSLSVYHLVKDRPYHEQTHIIDIFANIFKSTPVEVYLEVRKLLIEEVNNHVAGKATTFTSIRKNKYQNMENRSMSLMDNVCGSISDQALLYDNFYKVSFPLRVPTTKVDPTTNVVTIDGVAVQTIIPSTQNEIISDSIVVLKTSDNLVNTNIWKTTYKNSGVSYGSYTVPLLFNPSEDSIKQMSALQWLSLNYARVLNVSPSNEFIFYYFLADCLRVMESSSIDADVKVIYGKYIDIIMNGKNDNDKSMSDKIMADGIVRIPYPILLAGRDYSKIDIQPLSLFYLIITKLMIPKMTSPQITNEFKTKLEKDLLKYCSEDIKKDIMKDGSVLCVNVIDTLLSRFSGQCTNVKANDKIVNIIESHKIDETEIECCARIVQSDSQISSCDLCGSSNVKVTVNEKCSLDPKSIFSNCNVCGDNSQRPFYFDESKRVRLGLLDGERKDDKLIIPSQFTIDNDSVEVDNTIIIDPISTSMMRVKNKDEFKSLVDQKYPFLKDLDMTNVALAGGFCRSILLKQQMKDFDFFFHGLDNFTGRFKTFLTDLLSNIKKSEPTIKFGMFFKPMFNVFEVVCFDDPSNHINEEFTLDNFDKYHFLSLKDYNKRNIMSENDKFYFEDNDEKGVKMKYRLQFILCKFTSIYNIFESFDMFPSKVAYDGKNVYFTEKSLLGFRHMINEICYEGGSDLFKQRLSKYFKYGFSIVFPPNTRDWSSQGFDNRYTRYNKKSNNENIGPLSFKVRSKIDNKIYINHNSDIEKKLQRNEELEAKSLEQGKALYMSSLFCSFVSFLRYVKINNIDYIFPQYGQPDVSETGECVDNNYELSLPVNSNGEFEFKTKSTKIDFIDKLEYMYKERTWYEDFVAAMILNDYEENYD